MSCVTGRLGSRCASMFGDTSFKQSTRFADKVHKGNLTNYISCYTGNRSSSDIKLFPRTGMVKRLCFCQIALLTTTTLKLPKGILLKRCVG